MTAVLRVSGLTRSYGPIVAVDRVSFDVAPGELFAILGPSGCGKTTLLRLIAGLEAPNAGTIAIDGADVTAVPAYRRPVNTVFQSYALFPHMTVAQNIAFGLKQDALARGEIARRTEEMLALVQLSGFDRRRPDQLSGGQRQRVALARSLAKRPKLLLLDEPLAALDRKLREETRAELVRIQAQTGISFILVTHDQEEAMSLAQRIAVMRAGAVVQLDAPRAIYERPATRYVADFVGRVNLFAGELVAPGPRAAMRASELGAVLAGSGGEGVRAGTKVWLAVRPERITLDPRAIDGGENRLSGTVAGAAYLGESVLVDVALAGGRLVRVVVAASGRVPERGAAVSLAFAASAAVMLTE